MAEKKKEDMTDERKVALIEKGMALEEREAARLVGSAAKALEDGIDNPVFCKMLSEKLNCDLCTPLKVAAEKQKQAKAEAEAEAKPEAPPPEEA